MAKFAAVFNTSLRTETVCGIAGVWGGCDEALIRRMTARVGFPTLRLIRAVIGNIDLAGLAPGEWREVAAEDLS